jgi:hypothetical protein
LDDTLALALNAALKLLVDDSELSNGRLEFIWDEEHEIYKKIPFHACVLARKRDDSYRASL